MVSTLNSLVMFDWHFWLSLGLAGIMLMMTGGLYYVMDTIWR